MTGLVTRVIAKLEPGGAQLSALRVVRGLEAHGIASRVLVGWASPEGLALAARMGVAVEVYGAGGDQQWQADPHFARWLAPRLEDARLVHAHMFGGWWAASRAVPDGVPLVASEHNDLTWPAGEPLHALRRGLRRVDRLYAHGPGARRAILAAGLDPALIREGISRSPTSTDRRWQACRSRGSCSPGGCIRRRDLTCCWMRWRSCPTPRPRCCWGPVRCGRRSARQIRRLGLSGRVRLCGWRNRPSGAIAGAAVLVVPSRDESWSQTAVLGMARGVPVIGTDVDGLPRTLAAGRGIVVPSEDPAALAAAIDDVLANRRVTDLLGARRYALRFASERVAAEYAGAYAELAGELEDDQRDARAAVPT